MTTLRLLPLTVAVSAAALAASSGPAYAAEVLVVDRDGAQRINDPFVPSRAEIDLGRPPASPPVQAYPSGSGPRAVEGVLSRAHRRRTITRARFSRYQSSYRSALGTLRGLSGLRRTELGYVVRSVERIALAGRLTPSRMPALFLQLRRNSAYWPSRPIPAVGDQITFRGSELLYQYFPGRGLQLHPLSNFKKANLLHSACTRKSGPQKPVCGAPPPGPHKDAPCRPKRLRHLLDELSALAVHRGRGFVAWEYNFDFGGGSPPWMSGMAQATAVTALGRAAKLLNRPGFNATAKAALGAFEASAPLGVKTRGPLGGVHYLQYSFAPRLYIFNAFLQSLIGLRDYGKLTGDPRAMRLYDRAEPEARRFVPYSDVGDWSMYNFRGHESSPLYHELLREVLQSMGRRVGGIYCTYAIRYRGYQINPPKIAFKGPARAVDGRLTRLRFTLSKLSIVELKIYRGGRLAHRTIATLRRGSHSLPWRPRSSGSYTVRLGAKELRTGRSLRGRATGAISVEASSGRT